MAAGPDKRPRQCAIRRYKRSFHSENHRGCAGNSWQLLSGPRQPNRNSQRPSILLRSRCSLDTFGQEFQSSQACPFRAWQNVGLAKGNKAARRQLQDRGYSKKTKASRNLLTESLLRPHEAARVAV